MRLGYVIHDVIHDVIESAQYDAGTVHVLGCIK